MDNFIFSQEKASNDNQYYSLIGQEDFLDENSNPRIHNEEDPRVVAKTTKNKKSKHFNDNINFTRYYIKINPNLEVFNPIEYLTSIKDKKTFSHIHNVCKQSWYFKEVDSNLFNKYLTFLKNKNIHLLKDIERQIK